MKTTTTSAVCTVGVALMPLFWAGHVLAFNFNVGEVDASFDSTLSIGASWRVAEPDPQNFTQGNRDGGLAESGTNDDGTLNFDKGKTFSKIIKGVHDLQFDYQSQGIFTRFKYWYDKELKDERRAHGHGPNLYAADSPLDDRDYRDLSRFSGLELLDAYAYFSFNAGDLPVDLRLGRQVISWGESTFIQNSINTINPVDVSAFRRPGAEIKEGLLPVNMAFLSVGVTEDLSLDAFYQLEWEPTEIDPCGTYFSTSDVAASGCQFLVLSNELPDSLLVTQPVPSGVGALARAEDNEPGDAGQFGLALRMYVSALNDTEFGLYYINYHSRLPLLGVTTRFGTPNYYMAFPEDIKLFGMSFNTSVDEWAISGEISHRRDMPIQINGSEVIGGFAAALGLGVPNTFTPRVQPGKDVPGWDTFNVSQAQITALRTLPPALGASRFVFIAELGGSRIHGYLKSHPYGRSTNYGPGAPGDEGFVTQTAWGYRARVSAEYLNVLSTFNFTPVLSWSHDIDGVSPTGGSFNEGNKSIGLVLNAEYQSRYRTSLTYTNFFGGDFSTVQDRDFISLSASVSF